MEHQAELLEDAHKTIGQLREENALLLRQQGGGAAPTPDGDALSAAHQELDLASAALEARRRPGGAVRMGVLGRGACLGSHVPNLTDASHPTVQRPGLSRRSAAGRLRWSR